MKTQLAASFRLLLTFAIGLGNAALADNSGSSVVPATPDPKETAIPFDQIGAMAGKQYSGEGLSVTATPAGAQLQCVFQRLEGEATRDGLWLTSTVADQVNDRFRVKAVAVGQKALPESGVVSMEGQTARFTRPGLVEEYSVSMDGVRQDFVVLEKPGGASVPASRLLNSLAPPTDSELRVELSVKGAKVERTAHGAQLILEKSGRKIAYSRLKVTDTDGNELPARIEALSNSTFRTSHSELAMAVVVDDAGARYPVRIDPTFSDANWISMGGVNGADNIVYATVIDGAGNLYIGGVFAVVGDVIANRIAKWDGNSWSALGSGINNTVRSLAASGSTVYAGGYFTTAGGVAVNNIAKWDGSSWEPLGAGMNGEVIAMAVSGSDLYAGGYFTTAGGSTVNYIAKWNGSSWNALGSGIGGVSPNVLTVTASGNDVYAGGNFTTAGGIAAHYIAKWNGSSWSALGSGMNNHVYALAASGGDLYAGGAFTTAGGVAANRIAKWNGSSWSALGSGMNSYVTALAVSGGNVYAGGNFSVAGTVGAACIAKWNGSSWSTLWSGMNNYVYSMAVSGGDVFAGGYFTSAGGSAANRIAKWNGSSWSVPASGTNNTAGLNNYVEAVAVAGSNLYVCGSFTTVGGITANRIAKWNGSSWSALGAGMNNDVYALAVSGSDLYAGGQFSTAAGIEANYIAKWNGSSWSALGLGMDYPVYALAVLGNDVYAGGLFFAANGLTVNRIAKWNGSSWSALGSGMDSAVRTLAVSGTNLYVGGAFTTAGGIGANRIAKWNGTSWSALGSGMNNTVSGIVVSGNDIYAGGGFTTAGGIAANRIAKWNGNSWSALGSGVNDWVNALAVSGTNLYVGGYFTTAGGSAANRIAQWNGSSWSTLGSGMNNIVRALTMSSNGDIYAGGDFTTAGGKVSYYLARAIIEAGPPQITDQPEYVTTPAGATSVFNTAASGIAPLTYQWRKNGSNLINSGNIFGAATTSLTISNVQSGDGGIFSVVVSNTYGSVTSSVAVLTVSVPGELVTLGDYFPLPLNADWLYDGTDWDGALAKTRNHVVSVNTNITLYTGRSPAVAYSTNCVAIFAAYLNRTTLVAYDTWADFMADGGRYGQFGNDDLPSESLRVDGGVVFPAQMAVGASATNLTDAYMFGTFAGVMTNVLQVLERTSLAVPAGYFPDVLHVRWTVGFPGGAQVQEQWWAKHVGKIKRQGISGGGATHNFELIEYSVPIPPGILVNDGSMGFGSGNFGFSVIGQSGQTAVVEVSTNLANWLPVHTNTFGTGAFYFSDPSSSDFPSRFYRIRSP